MAGSIKPCVFCGEPGKKLTRGHIYGRQLLDELPRPRPGVPFLSSVMTLDPRRNEWDTVEIRDPKSLYYMPVNVICEPCNGVWMGTHEIAVRDILIKAQQGPPIRFTRSPQDRLALWISMISILSQYVHKSTVITPPADRLYVRRHDEPAPGTYIWLARSGEGPASLVGMVHALDSRITEEDNDWTRHRYVYCLVFGPFAAVLIGGLTDADGFEPELNTEPAGAFHRIWPREGSFGWSAETLMVTALDLDTFRKRVAAYLRPERPPLTSPIELLRTPTLTDP